MTDVILIINSGSSSIKFSIFACKSSLNLLYHGEIESIMKSPCFTLFDANHAQLMKQTFTGEGTKASLQAIFDWVKQVSHLINIIAVGHRVVHGGKYFSEPTIVTDEVVQKISSLIPFAPYHQPQSIEAINIIKSIYPNVLQVVCFDTSFHRTQARLATLFAIPQSLTNDGIIRFGFHGISYEYIASVMTNVIGNAGNGRVIVAHLGSGASMCAIYKQKSVATSMGLTALDGLMMGTRCGQIDPGVLLYLLQEKQYTPKQLEHLLYKSSGLIGVSGISSDMRKLEHNTDPLAIISVDLFCYRAARELGALSVELQGCDAIIFTAGIGENSSLVRKKICDRLQWLGVTLNETANSTHCAIISEISSRIKVAVIPTNEEWMMAMHTLGLIL